MPLVIICVRVHVCIVGSKLACKGMHGGQRLTVFSSFVFLPYLLKQNCLLNLGLGVLPILF